MHCLPRYLRGSASGGQSGVSFFPRLPRKTEQTVRGGQSCAAVTPAAPSPLPDRHSPAAPSPPSCPLLPAKKIPPGRICPSGPGFLCRPAHCARVNAAGKSPAVLIRRKNMKKKLRKIWRFGKKQYLCNPVRKEGHLRCPGARGNEAGESLRMESEVH